MTTTVKVEDAAEMLPDLLARVERGEEVVLERDGVPVVRMTGCETTVLGRKAIVLGRLRGMGWISDDFDEPLSDEELDLWDSRPLATE